MIAAGIFLFALFSWQMSSLSLDAGAGNITVALLWRAVGLAVVTVPLTTLAVSSLEPKDIPQGAALNNMMRQLGGSFGIALVNTYLHQRNAVHRSDLVSNLTPDNPAAVQRLSAYTHYFTSKGATADEAYHQGLQLLDLSVTKQSNLMSFNDAYLVVGLIFLVALPLLLMATRKRGAKPAVVLSDH
jgi:DHA2 family multidrug resistance protein